MNWLKWENTTSETVLESGTREEIRRSWQRTCEDNREPPDRRQNYSTRTKLPCLS